MPRRGNDAVPGLQGGFFGEPGRAARAGSEAGAPLASRMRPRNLDEYVGQQGVIGPGTALRRMIEADDVPSMILWGPPGTGKTTLATIISGATQRHFDELSAVNSGVADMRKSVAEARDRLKLTGRRTILFIDEIHRFNRAQQDALLPHVEAGTVTLIGATTENPSFYVVAPLLSRCRVFVLKLLEPPESETILRRTLDDAERGFGGSGVVASDEVLQAIARAAGGDGRAALTILDLAARMTEPDGEGRRALTLDAVEQATQHPTLLYDKEGDAHYDQISAFIKSVRDSDPDGALYWLARMLEAGEDPLFVARRIVILAAEDVGLADPRALPLAVAAQQACHFLGMPEARLPLAEAVVYLARAPKSNSAYRAYEAAAEDARNTRNDPVPMHLRNAATGLMRTLGYGQGYRYAHDEPGHVVDQAHRPPSAEGHRYYRAGTLGSESLDGGHRPRDERRAKGDDLGTA